MTPRLVVNNGLADRVPVYVDLEIRQFIRNLQKLPLPLVRSLARTAAAAVAVGQERARSGAPAADPDTAPALTVVPRGRWNEHPETVLASLRRYSCGPKRRFWTDALEVPDNIQGWRLRGGAPSLETLPFMIAALTKMLPSTGEEARTEVKWHTYGAGWHATLYVRRSRYRADVLLRAIPDGLSEDLVAHLRTFPVATDPS